MIGGLREESMGEKGEEVEEIEGEWEEAWEVLMDKSKAAGEGTMHEWGG
jgi:hypothetical protein